LSRSGESNVVSNISLEYHITREVPDSHVSRLLTQHAQTLKGKEAYCFQAFAEALEIIPTTLAENAGLNPIAIVTELRNKHALGERNAGINVKKVSGAR
jgi:T-complex protein 1 subunit delta